MGYNCLINEYVLIVTEGLEIAPQWAKGKTKGKVF